MVATSFAAYMLGEFGWRWSFFGASIVLLVIWIIVLILHPNRPEDVGLEPIEDEDEKTTDSDIENKNTDSIRSRMVERCLDNCYNNGFNLFHY